MPETTSYHHGDLRRALVREATALLTEEGLGGLSLRAVARRAGVSQTAPYRHFNDKAALLASVAADGFRRFGDAMEEAANAEASDPKQILAAMGRAYVLFALENPALFRLMFGPEIPDKSAHEELRTASIAAFTMLAESTKKADADGPGTISDKTDPSRIRANWSLAHGLAMLLLDGQLTLPDQPTERIAYIDAVIGRGG